MKIFPHRITWPVLVLLLSGAFCHLKAQGVLIENKGQSHPAVIAEMHISGGRLFLEEQGYTVLLRDETAMSELWNHQHHSTNKEVTVGFHAVKVNFRGSKTPSISYSKTLTTYHNYYRGKNPEQWAAKVPLHREVYYHQVYPGIDWIGKTTGSTLKTEWVVQPGADPAVIKMTYTGHEGIAIENGKLMVKTSVQNWYETAPFAYQVIDGQIREIPCSYKLTGDEVGFETGPLIQENVPLVIDPVLVFSTYSGSQGDNFGFTATYDSRAHLYAGGVVDNADGEYPVTAGAYQRTFGGGVGTFPVNLACDISISKYDSSGSNLLYATYLGGSSDEYPHSLVVDEHDNLLVMGTTNSTNFPVLKNAYDTILDGGYDIIVVKFKPDGSALLGSTFLGGSRNDGLNSSGSLRYNYADDFRGDIITDDRDQIYLASTTLSTDLPLVHPIQAASAGGFDGCLAKFSPDLSQLLWSTYVGGGGSDALYSIKLDTGFIYAGGGTNSTNLDTTDRVLYSTNQGGVDGFLVKVNKNDFQLNKLSYFGTPEYDQVYFIDLDSRGTLYATGQTEGSIQPSPGTYGQKDKGQFITRMSKDLDSTYFITGFGSRNRKPDLSPSAFLVDKCNHIYFSGWGSNVRPDLNPGSTAGLEITADAVQKTTDSNDFYILVLDQDASSLLYSTYFGGDETDDHVDGGTSRFDKRGVIYQSVCSSCPEDNEPGHNDFPVTPNAAFIQNVSPRCSNASFKIDLQISDAVEARFTVTPRILCKPLLAQFENLSSPGKQYLWDFGDGSKDTSFLPPDHLYDKPGKYIISLTAIDSISCNFSDKYTLDVVVLDKPEAKFSYKFDGCLDELQLKNETENGREYLWLLGNGESSSETAPKVKYTSSGDYRITLIASPNESCPDTFFLDVPIDLNAGTELELFNVFTPNGDGKNECFAPKGIRANCDEIEWQVFNRWGECLFETKDPEACWNGKNALGEPYPDGSYFVIYYIRFGDESKQQIISGTLTLLR